MQNIHFIVIFSITYISATEVTECPNVTLPRDVRIEGCDKPPCLLHKGRNARVEIDFIVPYDINMLKPQVIAKALGISTNFPLPDQNACHGLTNGYCPVDEDEWLTYILEMPVENQYPKIPLSLKFSILDDNNKQITCFQIKCKVVS